MTARSALRMPWLHSAPGPGGNFIINGSLTNNGAIDIGGGQNAPGNRLVVNGNYIGNNGTMALNTYLGSDGSPSDRLVISNGLGSGNTLLHITNIGGPGAETRADGILVVSAINGAATTANAFALAGEVRAGRFRLRSGKGRSWRQQFPELVSALGFHGRVRADKPARSGSAG